MGQFVHAMFFPLRARCMRMSSPVSSAGMASTGEDAWAGACQASCSAVTSQTDRKDRGVSCVTSPVDVLPSPHQRYHGTRLTYLDKIETMTDETRGMCEHTSVHQSGVSPSPSSCTPSRAVWSVVKRVLPYSESRDKTI